MIDLALHYASKRWPVFPLAAGTKVPAIAKERGGHGCTDATLDVKRIEAWWTEYPQANVGIATGSRSGLLVVDIDPRKTTDWLASVNALNLPQTFTLASILRRIEALEDACPTERSEFEEAEIHAQIQARFAAHSLELEAYAGLSVPEKITEKRRQLAERIADWEARDPDAFGVNTNTLMHTLRCRLIEIDIEALENPSLDIEAARAQAHEDFRFRGRPQPATPIIERSTVVATIGVPIPDYRGPTRPKPTFDKLEGYRSDPRVERWEPSAT